MSVQFTDDRMNAITKMINSGETLIYSCGMFETPKSKYKLWLSGLSADAAIHKVENNLEQELIETFTQEPYQPKTKGHLQGSGGIRGHSAGVIFPYIIMAIGSFKLGFSYHLIGNGLKMGQSIWGNYPRAMQEATELLKW